MRTLYHWPLDPASRQARIALSEKKMRFKTVIINPWATEMNDSEGTPTGFDFWQDCPENRPPCLVEDTGAQRLVITGPRAIGEYCQDYSNQRSLMPTSAQERAEVRRLCDWFDTKFTHEVNAYILHERVEKTVSGGGEPHTPSIREGRDNLRLHLDYMTTLLSTRDWLACGQFSLADIAAGAHISCLDFIGEIRWRDWPTLKDWYQIFKSRPSVRDLLGDRIAGINPPAYYKNLDF